MNTHFPHRYEVGLRATGHALGTLSAPPRSTITGGPPPQFGGVEESWSPEHLLLGAASLCLMATFQALARKAHLELRGYEARAEGILDKGPDGVGFTEISLQVRLETAPGDEERAERLLHTAKKHCIVANALKVPVALAATVRAAAPL